MADDFFKLCRNCGANKRCSEDRTKSGFHRAHGLPDGFQNMCKECQRDRQRESRRKRTAARLEGIPEFEITVVEPRNDPPPMPTHPPPQPRAMPPEKSPEEATKEQLLIARLRKEASDAKAHARELEKLALSGDRVREILGVLEAPNVAPDPEWLRGARDQRSVTGTAVLFLSDIHADEVVQSAQVGGKNEYNREICIRRVRNTFKSTVVLLKHFMASPKYDGAVCMLGGDLVSGNIHEELTETNEAPIQQTMIVMEEVLIEGLGLLADEFGKVHVPCVTGNHGRMHKKPRAKNRAFENFEWSIYQRLAKYFAKDPRLTFDIPDGSDAFFNIYDKRFCLTHGDQFRGGDGVGGILVPIKRGLSRKQFRQTAMGDPFDIMAIGHWHTYVHLADLIVNGSVKGIDEYAYQGNFAFEEPTQALFVVHPEAGVTARWPVLCSYEGGRVKKA